MRTKMWNALGEMCIYIVMYYDVVPTTLTEIILIFLVCLA